MYRLWPSILDYLFNGGLPLLLRNQLVLVVLLQGFDLALQVLGLLQDVREVRRVPHLLHSPMHFLVFNEESRKLLIGVLDLPVAGLALLLAVGELHLVRYRVALDGHRS